MVSQDDRMCAPNARQAQWDVLTGYLEKIDTSPRALILYGPTSSGKSHTVGRLAELYPDRILYVDCKKFLYAKSVYLQILRLLGLIQHMDKACDTLAEFVATMRMHAKKDEECVIIVDHVESVKEAPSTLASVLADLSYLTGHDRLMMVLTARSNLEFDVSMHTEKLWFPGYSGPEIVSILSSMPPALEYELPTPDNKGPSDAEQEDDEMEQPCIPEAVWYNFCSTLEKTQGAGMPHNIELYLDLADSLWPKFVEPILSGTTQPTDFMGLLRNAKTLNLFTSDTFVMDQIRLSGSSDIKSSVNDLSRNGKYLLISAYLASYVPSRLDVRVFSRRREQFKRKSKGTTRKHKIPQVLIGPRAFELERLFAIFRSIAPTEGNLVTMSGDSDKYLECVLSADIYSQIATLKSLRLISCISALSGIEYLEGRSRWKALVHYEYIRQISRDLRFEVDKYLVD